MGKSYKKGGAINDADKLNEETSTDDINVEPMKNEPMKNEPTKNEPTKNEPKKYVDPTGKEWCECPPPKTTFNRIESIKNFGQNANDGLKNLQTTTLNKLSGQKDELQKNLSDKFKNFANNALGNKDKIIEPNANPEPTEVQKGGRRHTHKHCRSKRCHSKHRKNCHSNHKHIKHCHSKHCHSKRKHSKRKHSKSKHSKSKHSKPRKQKTQKN